jgi:hypothetical protein
VILFYDQRFIRKIRITETLHFLFEEPNDSNRETRRQANRPNYFLGFDAALFQLSRISSGARQPNIAKRAKPQVHALNRQTYNAKQQVHGSKSSARKSCEQMPNVKDEPRLRLARLVRKHEA